MQASKRVRELGHARRRLRERFGLRVSEQDVQQLSVQIGNATSSFTRLENQSNRVSIWRGTFAGHEMVLVYDKARNAVVSALTPEMWDFKKGLSERFW